MRIGDVVRPAVVGRAVALVKAVLAWADPAHMPFAEVGRGVADLPEQFGDGRLARR